MTDSRKRSVTTDSVCRDGGYCPNTASSSLGTSVPTLPGGVSSDSPPGILFCRKCRMEFVEQQGRAGTDRSRCPEKGCGVFFWHGATANQRGEPQYATVGIDPDTVLPEHIFLKPTVGGGVYGTLDVPWDKVAEGEIP